MKKIMDFVEKELSCSAHDISHIKRVYNLALKLAESHPDADLEIIRLSALLHDIARVKEDTDKTRKIDHAELGAVIASKFLKDNKYNEKIVEKVSHCIKTHRYRSSKKPETIEAKILFDADKLDCIGAVGIARSFMIAGQYLEPMFRNIEIEKYKKENLLENGKIKDFTKHAPNLEFEIKLKKIPDRLFLEVSKILARQKIEFMEAFYKELKGEVI